MEEMRNQLTYDRHSPFKRSTIDKVYEEYLGHYWLIDLSIGKNFFWLHDLKFSGLKSVFELANHSFLEAQPFKHTVTIEGAGRVLTYLKVSFGSYSTSHNTILCKIEALVEKDDDLDEIQLSVEANLFFLNSEDGNKDPASAGGK